MPVDLFAVAYQHHTAPSEELRTAQFSLKRRISGSQRTLIQLGESICDCR